MSDDRPSFEQHSHVHDHDHDPPVKTRTPRKAAAKKATSERSDGEGSA